MRRILTLLFLTATLAATATVSRAEPVPTLAELTQGLQKRQEAAKYVAGEAIQKLYRSQHWYESMRDSLLSVNASVEGWVVDKYDRGEFALRFRLGERDGRWETQALVWPGECDWGFRQDFKRAPLDTWDCYARTICRDGLLYWLVRSEQPAVMRGEVRDPEGVLMPSGEYRWPSQHLSQLGGTWGGPRKEPFATWICLPSGAWGWADRTNDNRYAELPVTPEVLDGILCFCMAQAIRRDKSIAENRCWVAPSLGYAILRHEAIFLSTDNPLKGVRTVRTWMGFQACEGGPALPKTYREDRYAYEPGRTSPWESSEVVQMTDLSCTPDPERAIQDELYPLGVVSLLPPGQAMVDGKLVKFAPGEAGAIHGARVSSVRGNEMWGGAVKFMKEPLPPDEPVPPRNAGTAPPTTWVEDNSEYLKPLTGGEITEINMRYGFR
ncbi:MAG TPA: hypothetical protein VGM19_09620 [Armatimonadota bacterium]|jgi:hypothetical protein